MSSGFAMASFPADAETDRLSSRRERGSGPAPSTTPQEACALTHEPVPDYGQADADGEYAL